MLLLYFRIKLEIKKERGNQKNKYVELLTNELIL